MDDLTKQLLDALRAALRLEASIDLPTWYCSDECPRIMRQIRAAIAAAERAEPVAAE